MSTKLSRQIEADLNEISILESLKSACDIATITRIDCIIKCIKERLHETRLDEYEDEPRD